MASTPKVASPTPTLHESNGIAPALAPFGDSLDPKSSLKNKGSAVASPYNSRPPSRDRSEGEEGRDRQGKDGENQKKGGSEGAGGGHEEDGRGREGSGGEGEKEEKKMSAIEQRYHQKRQQEENKDPNEVSFDGPDDQANPQNWSNKKKWFVSHPPPVSLAIAASSNPYAAHWLPTNR
jgi:hypothetical protein